MSKPTEKNIEQYIRFPSELSGEEKTWIEEWVKKDQEIRALAEWYKQYYKNVDQVEKDRGMFDAEKPVNITLNPYNRPQKIASNVFVLAAQTPAVDRRKANLRTIRTFVSEEHKTLIRVLYDSGKNYSKLHVISEFVDEDDIVLIEVLDDEHTLMVSDLGGTFMIPDRKISQENIKDWNRCELHLPVSKIRVFKDLKTGTLNFDSSSSMFEREDLKLNVTEDELQIEVNSKAKIIPDKVVVYTDNQSKIWPVEMGSCSLAADMFTDSVSSLYFFK